MNITSPPPPVAAREAAVVELLRRAASVKAMPRERIRCALAATGAGQAISAALRCHSHLALSELLHEYADEPEQTVTHLKHAIALCGRSSVPAQSRLAVLCRGTAIGQDLVRCGQLKAAQDLLETLQGALLPGTAMPPTAEGGDEPILQSAASDTASYWLLAHVGVLRVCLLVREGLLKPAERMLPDVMKHVDALPASFRHACMAAKAPGATTPALAAAISGPTRTALRRVLELQRALILLHQGELREATSVADELLRQTAAAAEAANVAEMSGEGGVGLNPDESADAAINMEAKLLRASLHVAKLEIDAAMRLADELKPVLCRAHAPRHEPEPSAHSPGAKKRPRAALSTAMPAGRAPGRAAWLLLLAYMAIALEQHEAANEMLQRASDAIAAAAHPAQAALRVWCRMLHALVDPEQASSRAATLRELSLSAEARTHRMLRGAVSLAQGEVSLAAGDADTAERLLTRCVKYGVGESRCDVLATASLTALASAIGAKQGVPPEGAAGASGDGGDSEGSMDAKRRRTEDCLSSALCVAAKMEDLHAQRRTLKGWAQHYVSIGDDSQASAFGDLYAEFEGKLSRRLRKAGAGNADLSAFVADRYP